MNFQDAASELYQLLRLRTLPVAIKLFERPEDAAAIPKVRRLPHRATMCQAIYLARAIGWTVGVTAADLATPNCRTLVGLAETPPDVLAGKLTAGVWEETQEDAARHQRAIPRVPARYSLAVLSPATSGRIAEPDLVLFFGDPAQMILFINGLQWKDYRRYQFFSSGETACADAVAQAWLSKDVAMTIPCLGERRFGQVQDDEMEVAMPPAMLVKGLHGLQALWKVGTARYPIPSLGAQADPTDEIRKVYPDLV